MNRANQTFSITAYDNGGLTLFVFDPNWDIRKRAVRFLIDVDYERWTIDGSAEGISVSLTMDEPNKSVRFLSQVSQGSALAVLNQDERRIALFSLAGSSAALTKLVECSNRIKLSDPFQSKIDPF